MSATRDLGKPTCVSIPPEKKAAFKELTASPDFSGPTIILALIVIPVVLTVDILAITGAAPLWGGLIVNTIVYYFFFTVIHDGVHRSISTNKMLNDFICQSAVSVYAPFAAMSLFRWAHMEHHRFTNDEKDPDIWCHGSAWTLPFRWMTIDVYYAYRAFTSDNPNMKRILNETTPFIIGGIAFIIGIIALGYGFELLMLWFIPSRLAFVGIGYAFFWLPHAHWPDDERSLKQSENFTLATLTRTGNEWIMSPLLQYQNYHLIHHLWPTTPFYNNVKLWRLLEPEMRERDLALVTGFQTHPEYRIRSPDAAVGAA